MYIDGHERSDVVEYKKITIRRLEICHGSPPACVVDPIVRMLSYPSMIRVFSTQMATKAG